MREIMPTNMATETMPAKTERVSFSELAVNILPYAPEQQKPGRLPPLDKRGVPPRGWYVVRGLVDWMRSAWF